MNLLEREYDALRAQRVALRRKREHLVQATGFAPMGRYGVDGYDNAIVAVEAALRGTERRWAELCTLLGRPYPVKPVKLGTPAHGTATSYAGPYLTRDMAPR